LRKSFSIVVVLAMMLTALTPLGVFADETTVPANDEPSVTTTVPDGTEAPTEADKGDQDQMEATDPADDDQKDADSAEKSGQPQKLETKNTDPVTSVTVSFTAQAENAFLCAPQQNVTVYSNEAEQYGYVDEVKDGVSALDVLVKAHEVVFGDAFGLANSEMKGDKTVYNNGILEVSETGWILGAFNKGASSCSYTINGKQPHDNTLSGDYYTGYMITQAQVNNGDQLEFFTYQDEYYMDNYVSFYQNEKVQASLQIEKNETVNLQLKGYPIGWYGSSLESVIQKNSVNIEAAQLCLIDPMTGEKGDIKKAVTDENGNVTLKFDTEGDYLLSAYIPAENIDDRVTPIIMPLLSVTVTDSAAATDPTESVDPTDDNQQATTDKTKTTNDSATKTGDSGLAPFWIVLLILAAGGAAALVITRRTKIKQ